MQKKKTQYSVLLSKETDRIFTDLHSQNPDGSKNLVFADAVRFAHANGMYANRYRIPGGAESKQSNRGGHDIRETWAVECGGKVDFNGVFTYAKYEKTPTGRYVRTSRSQPIKSMPEDYSAFKKAVLGPFLSVVDAEQKMEDQADKKVKK